MVDEPIRVSSTSWTGLPAEPAEPPPPPKPKSPPSPFKGIVAAILLIGIGVQGTWQAFTTGEVRCRGCSAPYTAVADAAHFNTIALILILCVPVGLVALVIAIRDAWRDYRRRRLRPGGPDQKTAG